MTKRCPRLREGMPSAEALPKTTPPRRRRNSHGRPLKDIAAEAGISETTLRNRLNRGESLSEALTPRKWARTPLKRLAEESGVSIYTLYSRLRAGVPMKDLLVPRREKRGGKSYEKLIAEAGLKLTKQGLSLRLKKGMSLEEALSTPPRRGKPARFGRPLAEIAMDAGMPLAALRKRLKAGMSVEEAVASWRDKTRTLFDALEGSEPLGDTPPGECTTKEESPK